MERIRRWGDIGGGTMAAAVTLAVVVLAILVPILLAAWTGNLGDTQPQVTP